MPKFGINESSNSFPKVRTKVERIISRRGALKYVGNEMDDGDYGVHILINNVPFTIWNVGLMGVAAAIYASDSLSARSRIVGEITHHLAVLSNDTSGLFDEIFAMFGITPDDFR